MDRRSSPNEPVIFIYSRKNDLNLGNINQTNNDNEFQFSQFDIFLREKWNSAMKNGYFRYNLEKVQTRIIPGIYKYVAQLNVQRATNRRPPEFMKSVKEKFDHDKFNFNKIPIKEVLFELSPEESLAHKDDGPLSKVKHQVIINVSPAEMGHVLLVPFVDQCLPQILTASSLALALDMVLLSKHRGFRVGWNSLCAFASVNHLHFHALYLDYGILMDHMPVSQICNKVYETKDIKCRGFAFQLADHSCTDQLSRLVWQITDYFTENEIAHNLTITRGKNFINPNETTLRVLLWPRKTICGLCNDCFNCAAYEMGGHLPIKDKEEYHLLTEERANSIFEQFSLSDTDFNALKIKITQLVCKR